MVVAIVVAVATSLPLLLSLSVLLVIRCDASDAAFDVVLNVFDVANMLEAELLSPSSPVVWRWSHAFFKCRGAVAAAIANTKQK